MSMGMCTARYRGMACNREHNHLTEHMARQMDGGTFWWPRMVPRLGSCMNWMVVQHPEYNATALYECSLEKDHEGDCTQAHIFHSDKSPVAREDPVVWRKRDLNGVRKKTQAAKDIGR